MGVSTTPQVHCLVTLTDQLGRQYRSRIEDVDDGMLVLARPLDLPVEHEFGVGAPVLVSWSDPAGIIEVDTELLDSQLPGRLGCWLVGELGPYRIQQRRQFVRVPVPGLARFSVLVLDAVLVLPAVHRDPRVRHNRDHEPSCGESQP